MQTWIVSIQMINAHLKKIYKTPNFKTLKRVFIIQDDISSSNLAPVIFYAAGKQGITNNQTE